MIDYFSADLEIKQVSVSRRLIVGTAAAHHNIDRVRDIIDPSASQKATRRLSGPADVAVFVGHNSGALPIGIPQRIEATPQGLYTETYVLKGPAGDNLLAVAKDLADHGQALGMSIGYKTHDSRRETAGGKTVRRIMDYELKEYSFAAQQAIANPDALVSAVKSRRARAAQRKAQDSTMQYRVEQQEGASPERWSVLCDTDGDGDADDNVLVGTYPSAEVANAVADALRTYGADADDDALADDADDADEAQQGAADKTAPTTGAPAIKATWSTEYVNNLPNSSFLYVEDGADDDEGKRVPRSKRHLPYRDAEGKIDLPHLRAAISRLGQDGTLPGLDDGKKTQLQARARRLLAQAESGKTYSEAEEWKAGAPLVIEALAYRLHDLAEQLSGEHKAMEALRQDTRAGQRMTEPARAAGRAVLADLRSLLDVADAIEAGTDEQQRLAWYRQQLAHAVA